MEIWKRNLYVLSACLFLVMVAMSMVMPFLPLFIQQDLGITDEGQVTTWAGIIFGANFLTAGLVSPIWGNLADKHGRKIMILRSGYFMSIIIAMTGFAGSVWQLLGLRLLNGTVGGIMPASTALIASMSPPEKAGWAQGTLQSSAVAGTIMGPFFGGLLAEAFGFRIIFVLTGCLVLIATIIVTFTVKEEFTPPPAKEQSSIRQDFKMIFSTQPLPALFFTTIMIQFALLSINPVLPIYVKSLMSPNSNEGVAFFAGLVTAAMGLANVIASPQLGKLGDRFGSQKVLLGCLFAAAVIILPQAFVTTVWQLVILRFMQGLCIGGLLPSVNSIIRKVTPSEMTSRVYGYNNSFVSFGSMLGPMTGGYVASIFQLRSVFWLTSSLLIIGGFWVWHSLPKIGHVGEADFH